MTRPKVSVLMVTYNHVRFISEAVESVLAQETDFPFELIIGDDCSTDGTADIVRRFATRFPERIRAVLHPRNLGGYGSRNFLHVTGMAQGDYLAILEGDDLFTDPRKLQLQAALLDHERDCAGCFHDCSVIDADGRLIEERYAVKLRQPRVSQAEIVVNGNNAVTNTRMYRRACVEHYPAWYLAHTMDWGLEILVAGRGDWCYLERTMSAYRVHQAGTFSSANLYRRHQFIIDMTETLLREPAFAAYRTELKQRLFWMNRDLANNCRNAGDHRGYLKYLSRCVPHMRKDLNLLRFLFREVALLMSATGQRTT